MIRVLNRIAGWLALLLLSTQPAQAAEPLGQVYVIGALHGLHAEESAFDFEDLGRLIEAIQPDVVVLEVRPDELEGRLQTPGRPEYPAVLWPWLANHDVEAVAMEPGGEDFTRITQAAGAQIASFQATRPEEAAYWGRLQDSLESALRAYWTGVANTQNQVTADLARAYTMAEVEMVGPAFGTAQAEWDGYMLAEARTVVLANPGKRILVLGSYRNRAGLHAGLRAAAGDRVVDTEAWLRAGGFDLPAPPETE